MRIITSSIKDLSHDLYGQCKMANFRYNGFMFGRLQHCRAEQVGHAVIALEGDTLLGWALIFEDEISGTTAYFYVKNNYRRQGIGTQLLTTAKEQFGTLYVYGNPILYKFFGRDSMGYV